MATVDDLGRMLATYLRDAEAGRALAADGEAYTPAGIRRLRAALVLVDVAVGTVDPGDVDPVDAATIDRLSRQVSGQPGPRPAPAEPVAAVRTPTATMLALGTQVSSWLERIVVIAFVLAAIGLALELV
jgi:hypothetical protein